MNKLSRHYDMKHVKHCHNNTEASKYNSFGFVSFLNRYVAMKFGRKSILFLSILEKASNPLLHLK